MVVEEEDNLSETMLEQGPLLRYMHYKRLTTFGEEYENQDPEVITRNSTLLRINSSKPC